MLVYEEICNVYIRRQALATLGSSMLSYCAGMAFGVTAVMLPRLREDEELQYDGSDDSWITSVACLTMIIGGLGAGSILDIYGRKVTHIITAIPFIIGWTCIAFANSTSLIILGRLITGISAGAHKPIILVYIGEIADPKYRTLAFFIPGLMINIGILFSHFVGSFYDWKLSAMICTVLSVISSVYFLFLKESPLWLISKGRIEEGVYSFHWFRGTSVAAEAELKSVLQKQRYDKNTSAKDVVNILCSLSCIKPFVMIVLIMAAIQFSGQNLLNSYGYDIFKRLFSDKVDPFMMIIATDFIRGFFSIIICVLVSFVSRKIAFLVCTFGIAVLFYLALIYLSFGHLECIWFPIVCLVLYIGLSTALFIIGWTFVPEVMPTKIRGFGSGLASATFDLFLFVILKVTPDILNRFGDSTMYASLATCSIISGLFLSFLLPDTNGKTLQAIEDTFIRNNKITEQTTL